MKLKTARIRNYRSVRDTETFEVESQKTILVGPNEAGKSAILQALQQVNPPESLKGFDPLRDYPRALYNDITTGKLKPSEIPVVEAVFTLDEDDNALIPREFQGGEYKVTKYLDNRRVHSLSSLPPVPTYKDVKADIARLATHIESNNPDGDVGSKHKTKLHSITETWTDETSLNTKSAAPLAQWLEESIPLVDESNEKEENRREKIGQVLSLSGRRASTLKMIENRVPVFVLFSNYFRVHPIIHLEHLARRLEENLIDDENYDYGNSCLLKLLGFEARELSDLGKVADPSMDQPEEIQNYRDQLDNRSYQLNAASVRLTDEITAVWNPDESRDEANRLRVAADGQYLKVVVEDDLGVEIELNQRSEGFQWLVSFFVVFFAEAAEGHENAILLLDEPGLSLHALKQREFRRTVSQLSGTNQTIYTTHSPFLVGPDELDQVRVVEMSDRRIGTKVHTTVTSKDPAALLPLQEALGYDLAQSLFSQQRNLVLEGLTDYWYVEGISSLLEAAGETPLNDKIALIPAKSAGKVVYFATILHANSLKVAALLDSDNAGEQAAKQKTLVHTLGQSSILRTQEFIESSITHSEIEDLLRETLVTIARDELGWDISNQAKKQPNSPVVSLFEKHIKDFSKYTLAKSFVKWVRDHEFDALTETERKQCISLVEAINKALK